MFKDARNFYRMTRNEGITFFGSVVFTIIMCFAIPFVKLTMWMIPERKDFGPFKGRKDLE